MKLKTARLSISRAFKRTQHNSHFICYLTSFGIFPRKPSGNQTWQWKIPYVMICNGGSKIGKSWNNSPISMEYPMSIVHFHPFSENHGTNRPFLWFIFIQIFHLYRDPSDPAASSSICQVQPAKVLPAMRASRCGGGDLIIVRNVDRVPELQSWEKAMGPSGAMKLMDMDTKNGS